MAAAADPQDSDSDADCWVVLDPDNPANSSDDDAGVLSLSSASDDDDELLACYSSDCLSDDEGLYDLDDAEEVVQPRPTAPKPLSGLFHHTLTRGVNYAAFDPVPGSPDRKDLIPDPGFSACSEKVTVVASTRGLVVLCAKATGDGGYIVANPATYNWVRLPSHACDHRAWGDPCVVITFEDADTCCADHSGHYHVIVAFRLQDGIYAYESFSSRTWQWTVGAEVSAVENVVPASGVGALGCAFWRTTLGYLLCYNPAAGTQHLIPAPLEVHQWPHWELGEMNGTLSVTCMDDLVNVVIVLNLHLEHGGAGDIRWSLAGHFEGGCLRNRDRVQLLRSQGPEVVMWDPTLEVVVAMDMEGRTTRTIGPLSGLKYYSDFIPFVSSSTGITTIEAGAECTLTAADVEA